jgi:hypothetical protein
MMLITKSAIHSNWTIVVARVVLYILVVGTFFLPWGTGWTEPRHICEDTVCTGYAYQGQCYYSISGWEAFILGCFVLVIPAIALIVGGLGAIIQRHPNYLYLGGLAVFLLFHVYFLGAGIIEHWFLL